MNGIDGTIPSAYTGSVLKEILDTPFIKEMLWKSLVNINPKNGAELVRTLLWEDVGVALALVDGLPAIINYLIGALSEVIIQAEEKFPPPMLLAVIQALREDLDTEPLHKAGSAAIRLTQGLIRASGTDTPKAVGKAITVVARNVNDLHSQDPTQISALAKGIMANIDAHELSRMTGTILNAVLDQRPKLFSWAAQMLAGRVRERFTTWKKRRQTL